MNDAKPQASLVLGGVSLCFLLSGFAALLYQTAWMRQITTVFGTSELAIATVLAAYMGGLAFGAAVAGRYVDRIRRPVLTYGILEAVVAVSALTVPWLLGIAGLVYAAIFGGQAEPPDASGAGQSLYYLAATFLVLAIPTACMGATLPILTRYAVRSDDDVGPRVGLLYAINTLGAVAGTLVAAFVLLPALGLIGTIGVGATTNLLIFIIAAGLARTLATASTDPPVDAAEKIAKWRPAAWILPVMLASGVTTFAYEVLWTRLLSQVLGGSVIAFATMLASFLSGIALGSAIASRFAKQRSMSVVAFIVAELGIAATSIAIYQSLDTLTPETAGLAGNVILAMALMLPATLFIGATFPLAVRILSENETDAPAETARVYAWNTVGAIFGAAIAGFALIPLLKYEGTIKLAVSINILLALLVAVLIPKRRPAWIGVTALALVATLAVFRPEMPESLLRVSPLNHDRNGEIRYYDVGRSATVLVLESDGYFNFRTNGLPEASTDLKGAPPSRSSGRLLAALPVVARPAAENMLIIGLGGGVVAEGIPGSIKSIDIIELEPKVVAANRAIADSRNVDPLSDSRINIIINDARNALRLTDKQYDIIVSQPSHPWTAGASHLYTREFMQLARSRLTSEGVFLQWMNAGFVSEDLLRSLAATLLDVFPHVRAYQFDANVIFFLASNADISPEQQMLASGEPLASYREEFARNGIASVNDVLAALAWDEKGLGELARNAPIISDNDNLMAMQSGSVLLGGALGYARLKELIREHGPLFDAQSPVHRDMSDDVDFLYVGDRLTALYASELALALAEVLKSKGRPEALTLAAKYLQRQGQSQRADQILLAALEQYPSDPIAAYLLLNDRRASVISQTLPERIAPYVANLTAPARAVVQLWGATTQTGRDLVAQSEDTLASAASSEQWYLRAAKLRADWRIWAVQNGAPATLAADALDIIDNAIALHQDLDTYGMRMAAAFLADDYNAVVETARRMVWVIRSDVEFRRKNNAKPLSTRELVNKVARLQSMQTGLQRVRESGRIDAYKFGDLDEQIGAVLKQLERRAPQD